MGWTTSTESDHSNSRRCRDHSVESGEIVECFSSPSQDVNNLLARPPSADQSCSELMGTFSTTLPPNEAPQFAPFGISIPFQPVDGKPRLSFTGPDDYDMSPTSLTQDNTPLRTTTNHASQIQSTPASTQVIWTTPLNQQIPSGSDQTQAPRYNSIQFDNLKSFSQNLSFTSSTPTWHTSSVTQTNDETPLIKQHIPTLRGTPRQNHTAPLRSPSNPSNTRTFSPPVLSGDARPLQDTVARLKTLEIFSKSYSVKSSIPKDLAPFLIKDVTKQREVADRSLDNVNQHSQIVQDRINADQSNQSIPSGPRNFNCRQTGPLPSQTTLWNQSKSDMHDSWERTGRPQCQHCLAHHPPGISCREAPRVCPRCKTKHPKKYQCSFPRSRVTKTNAPASGPVHKRKKRKAERDPPRPLANASGTIEFTHVSHENRNPPPCPFCPFLTHFLSDCQMFSSAQLLIIASNYVISQLSGEESKAQQEQRDALVRLLRPGGRLENMFMATVEGYSLEVANVLRRSLGWKTLGR